MNASLLTSPNILNASDKSLAKHFNVNMYLGLFYSKIHLAYRKVKKSWARDSFNYSRAPSSEKYLIYG